MKRVGYLIERIATIDNLYLAYYKASRGKRSKECVIEYSNNLSGNIKTLQYKLLYGDLNIGNYHYFTIKDPKERQICAADFSERVLHHALMNVCHPYFERTLIYDTYATRHNKGIYAALSRGGEAMRNNMYVAKLDFRKYFDSISHEILKKKLRRLFKDARLLDVFDEIIDSYCSIKEGFGIPIGNLTSQYFANYYLSDFDHYCKEELQVKTYVRYMDDILIYAEDKQLLKEKVCMMNVKANNLSLILKPAVIRSCEHGISFLGYIIYPHKMILNRRSRYRFRKKMALYSRLLNDDVWNQHIYQSHIIPLLAFTMHGYTKQFRRRVSGFL